MDEGREWKKKDKVTENAARKREKMQMMMMMIKMVKMMMVIVSDPKRDPCFLPNLQLFFSLSLFDLLLLFLSLILHQRMNCKSENEMRDWNEIDERRDDVCVCEKKKREKEVVRTSSSSHSFPFHSLLPFLVHHIIFSPIICGICICHQISLFAPFLSFLLSFPLSLSLASSCYPETKYPKKPNNSRPLFSVISRSFVPCFAAPAPALSSP